jgi:MFS family permease
VVAGHDASRHMPDNSPLPAEIRVVNLAGLAQGVTLVTFPAASSVLTDPDEYGLSSTQYGDMFVPQVLTAISAALLGSSLARRTSAKTVLLLGLGANIAAMLVLVGSTLVKDDLTVAYPLLLVATACLGVGFGLTVPVLNTYVAQFRPAAPDRAVLVLNALLGFGTALAPVFVAVFVGLGFWWGLPVLSATALVGAQLELTDNGASVTQASLGLTAFWAMVTVGRLLFASIGTWVPASLTYHVLPVVLAAAFLVVAALPDDAPWLGVTVFGLAGLGCSALLPLTISLGQRALPSMAALAGGVIACYQVGYGIAAFGVGRLVDAGHELTDIYRATSLVAVALALLSFSITRGPAATPRRRTATETTS